MNGHFSRFTTDKLLDFLKRLDRKVTIEVSAVTTGEPIRRYLRSVRVGRLSCRYTKVVAQLESDMEWAIFEYASTDVDGAGAIIAKPDATSDELDRALPIVNNWRAAHAFPLNTFQLTLRKKARGFDPDSPVAQRTKRLRAIRHKLQKRTRHPIILSDMQDIAGCRAVVKDMGALNKLYKAYIEGDLKHDLENHRMIMSSLLVSPVIAACIWFYLQK